MKKIESVQTKNLKGYRAPTEQEIRKIFTCMEPDLKQRRKQMKLFRVILASFGTVIMLGVIYKITNGSGNYVESIIGIMIALAFWGSFIALNKSLGTNRILENYVRNGKYQVLDCLSYEHHYAQDPTRTEGSVKIQTKDGIPCMGNFVVDIETALLSEKGELIPLLLMYEKETGESRVFSEKMLNGR